METVHDAHEQTQRDEEDLFFKAPCGLVEKVKALWVLDY
jgi:hypothetical protein